MHLAALTRPFSRKTLLGSACVLLMGAAATAPAAVVSTNYSGNGASGFGNGGVVGNGSLTVSDDTTAGTVTFTYSGTASSLGNNDLVVYLNTQAGGFADTSTFSDNGDGGREAISGFNSGNASRALVSFPAGFGADLAIGFEDTIFNGAFGLASGGNNSLNFIAGNSPGTPDSITLTDAQLGITATQGFSFVGTLVSTSAYRSNETIGTSVTTPGTAGDAPNAGFTGTQTFSTANVFAVPEPGTAGLIAAGVAMLGFRRRR